MRRKSQTEIEIPRIGIKVQRFWVCSTESYSRFKFEMFVLPTHIPRFKFLQVCSLTLFLFQVFW